MSSHATSRTSFDRELRTLRDQVLVLGSMVENAIVKSMDVLVRRDLKESSRVVQDDDLIDKKRFEIEERCIDLMATQQPMAGDLRVLIAILHISVELERMGDYAEGIGRISLMMGEEGTLKPLLDIPRMADRAVAMLRRSLDAFVARDTEIARRVCDEDDEVDALYDQVYRELLTYMIEDPATIRKATYLLWVAHDLERIADRATNVAERAIFLATGQLTEVNVSKY
ncbi:MAG: phosphate signaling complex protein PhoU [Dehalococcoidia bacterium]|nr:phosphate signaling complex protein PhoU [Dehalococcoidia bacterium]